MIVLGMSEQEDFHRPEKPREIIDNKATILEKTEMKRKFSRSAKLRETSS